MPKKCKNPLAAVTATIAYYMELSDMTNKEICQKLMISFPTWIDKKKNPDKFTLGDLSILSKIFGIDIMVLVGGLIPKEKGTIKNE
jgi:hypothetical protein